MSNSFVECPCAQCKEVIWLTSGTAATLRRSNGTFYCLWGHKNWFPPKEVRDADAAIRRERDLLKQQLAYKDDRFRQEREAKEAAERRASAARGQVTKLKKRAANGVCPCCNRTFVDLQRHMAAKHAGFVAEEIQTETGSVVH